MNSPQNAQEIFDHVVENLRKQKYKSASSNSSCLYRGPNGRKCAAGWLIPDEIYDPCMEKSVVRNLNFFSNHPVYGKFLDLINDLQYIHDYDGYSGYGIADWESSWEDLARKYNLIYNQI